MTGAAERLAAVDNLPARELLQRAASTLDALVTVMNEETTLLRAGHVREATQLTAEKTRLAQEYTGLVRSIQRQTARLVKEAPEEVQKVRAGHERLVTQMAENLRVIATARTVTEDLLTDVARSVGQAERPKTYGTNGQVNAAPPAAAARGIAVNRSL